MKRKILFLSPLPPPYYGSALSSKECLGILEGSKEFKVRNIKLNYSESMKDIGKINLNKIKGIFRVSRQIKQEINLFNPDIVYFVPATSGLGLIRDAYFVRQIKKIWKGKILFHIRSRISDEDWKNPLFRYIYVRMFKNQKAIVLGKTLKKDLHNLIPDRDISVLPNAIKNEISEKEIKRIIKKRNKLRTFNILFLSNMDRTKGWPKLLEACKILDEKKINFRCSFVGAWRSKKDEKKFYKFIKKNNLQNKVFYLGKKTGKEKNKILENSDVLVFPTEYKLETFGRVIIEAMMYALPVIANSIASIPEIIEDKKTGYLLKENNPQEIVKDLLMPYKNKKFIVRFGLTGRKRFLERYELSGYKKKFKKITFSLE